jgi:hypothetical protein
MLERLKDMSEALPKVLLRTLPRTESLHVEHRRSEMMKGMIVVIDMIKILLILLNLIIRIRIIA